jgi:hypothetical protein
MSKKRFSAGLDDLFNDNYAASMTEQGGVETRSPAPTERKASSHKNFLSDLDSLLQEVLEESIEKFEANQPDSVTASGKTKTTTAPRESFSGLDALIRQTIDVQEIMTDENNGKKRLTVTVDRSKLNKLKTIARLENAYLKDLVSEVIDGYIEEYIQQRGIQI